MALVAEHRCSKDETESNTSTTISPTPQALLGTALGHPSSQSIRWAMLGESRSSCGAGAPPRNVLCSEGLRHLMSSDKLRHTMSLELIQGGEQDQGQVETTGERKVTNEN